MKATNYTEAMFIFFAKLYGVLPLRAPTDYLRILIQYILSHTQFTGRNTEERHYILNQYYFLKCMSLTSSHPV